MISGDIYHLKAMTIDYRSIKLVKQYLTVPFYLEQNNISFRYYSLENYLTLNYSNVCKKNAVEL